MFGRADFKVIILIMLMAIILAVTFALAYYFLINRPEYAEGTYETVIDNQAVRVESDPRKSVKIISTPGPEPTGLPVIEEPVGQGDGETEENVTVVAPEPTIIVVTPLPTAPPPAPATAVPPTPVPVNQYNFVNYQVVPGDTLWSVSRKHNTTISLMARFGIDATDIVPGTVIRIAVANPAYCPGTRTYIVEKGDTLSSIARKTGTTVQNLQQINGFGPNFRLDTTMVVCVPN